MLVSHCIKKDLRLIGRRFVDANTPPAIATAARRSRSSSSFEIGLADRRVSRSTAASVARATTPVLPLALPYRRGTLRLAVPVVRGHACARQFRRSADLGAGHVAFQFVSRFSGGFTPVGTGDVEPHMREHGILEDASP